MMPPKATLSALAFLCMAVGSDRVLAQEALPANTTPLSAVEMYLMFRDKTWIWKSGAGRFFAEDRKFLAWVNEDGREVYGEGRYILTNDGRLCLDAKWEDKIGSARSEVCFLHRRDRGTIYQQREGTDRWYIFKNYNPAVQDEFDKLVDDDEVSEQVTRIKRELSGSNKLTSAEKLQ